MHFATRTYARGCTSQNDTFNVAKSIKEYHEGKKKKEENKILCKYIIYIKFSNYHFNIWCRRQNVAQLNAVNGHYKQVGNKIYFR
jgi:hypothetical protein